MRSLITLDDLKNRDISSLTDRAVDLYRDCTLHDRPLAGRLVASLFLLTSTRTRAAFSSAALRLGASLVTFGPNELQLNTGESINDTARVFGSMFDLTVIRSQLTVPDLRSLAELSALPVVNAMSSDEHPTQGLSDVATLRLRFGELTGLRMLYIGEGNNTAIALAKVLPHIEGAHLTFWTPPGYSLNAEFIDLSNRIASGPGGLVEQVHQIDELPADINVVYTTRWRTTGTVKPDVSWLEVFRPFYVDDSLLSRWPEAVVMHDLPAHRGQEIAGDVLGGPRSIAWLQAGMKAASAMAVLERCGK